MYSKESVFTKPVDIVNLGAFKDFANQLDNTCLAYNIGDFLTGKVLNHEEFYRYFKKNYKFFFFFIDS